MKIQVIVELLAGVGVYSIFSGIKDVVIKYLILRNERKEIHRDK